MGILWKYNFSTEHKISCSFQYWIFASLDISLEILQLLRLYKHLFLCIPDVDELKCENSASNILLINITMTHVIRGYVHADIANE